MFWIPPAYHKAKKLIRQNQYSSIITVSWPVSPHVVGSLIHKHNGKNIPWLVDIGDPFSFNKLTPINDFKKFSKKNQKFERSLLKDANAITVTTEETKKDYIQFFPAVESKIVVIPPLIPTKKEKATLLKTEDMTDSQKIKLVFTGSLRSKNRRPDTLLSLFSQLITIPEFSDLLEVHFYGDINQCLSSFVPYEGLIGKQIFLHGIVKKEVIDDVLSKASFLINIGNVSENKLPSKIVEYLSANRPIINIAKNYNDSSWNFLSSSGIALNILASAPQTITPEIIDQVAKFIKNPPQVLSVERLNTIIAPFTSETISKQYLQIIKVFNQS